MKFSSLSVGRMLTVLAAIVLTVVRFPEAWVERYYSSGIYPRLAGVLKPLAVYWPVSILDTVLVATAVGLAVWWVRRLRGAAPGRRWAAAGKAAWDTAALAAVLVCAFELLWGLNYQRQPLSARMDWETNRVTPAAALALARSAINQANEDAVAAHAQKLPERWQSDLERSFAKVVEELGGPSDFRGVEPRRSLVIPLLQAEGCEGFINPFGYEVILDDETLDFERPFLLAHEWSHVAGYANEAEANFIGILTCLRSDVPMIRYSGALNLSLYLPRRVVAKGSPGKNQNPAASLPEYSALVIHDLNAINARMRKHYQPLLGNLQARIYNQFLRANRVQAGIGSYGLVAQLMIGERFETNWTPVMRGTEGSRTIAGD